jgi:hypothetical protein
VWRTIGASVIGASHAATETRCQDHSAYAIVPVATTGGALILAVADGAGSASASFHGAKTAVATAIGYLATELALARPVDATFVADCFTAARARVLEIAADYEHDTREYASTLLVALATADATFAGQIGDGAVVVDDGVLRAMTWPQQGEYANSTTFLVDDDALDRLIVAEGGPARRIALLSDGLQNLALDYETQTPFEPFFAPFFAYLESASKDDGAVEQELRDYLDSLAVNQRTDDDKSLVLAVRR